MAGHGDLQPLLAGGELGQDLGGFVVVLEPAADLAEPGRRPHGFFRRTGGRAVRPVLLLATLAPDLALGPVAVENGGFLHVAPVRMDDHGVGRFVADRSQLAVGGQGPGVEAGDVLHPPVEGRVLLVGLHRELLVVARAVLGGQVEPFGGGLVGQPAGFGAAVGGGSAVAGQGPEGEALHGGRLRIGESQAVAVGGGVGRHPTQIERHGQTAGAEGADPLDAREIDAPDRACRLAVDPDPPLAAPVCCDPDGGLHGKGAGLPGTSDLRQRRRRPSGMGVAAKLRAWAGPRVASVPSPRRRTSCQSARSAFSASRLGPSVRRSSTRLPSASSTVSAIRSVATVAARAAQTANSMGRIQRDVVIAGSPGVGSGMRASRTIGRGGVLRKVVRRGRGYVPCTCILSANV